MSWKGLDLGDFTSWLFIVVMIFVGFLFCFAIYAACCLPDKTADCYLCLTEVNYSTFSDHRRECATSNYHKLQGFQRRHDKTCPTCFGDLRLWPTIGKPFLCDTKPSCRYSLGSEIVNRGGNRWNCFICDIDFCVNCIGEPPRSDETRAVTTRLPSPANLPKPIQKPTLYRPDQTKCHLCHDYVDNGLWKDGSHRRECAVANPIMDTFDLSVVKCPECSVNLKLWPVLGDGSSKFRCDTATCSYPSTEGEREIQHDGHNRYCCFLCDYNLCVYCVNAVMARNLREQANSPSAPPLIQPPEEEGQNLLPPSYESAINETQNNSNSN